MLSLGLVVRCAGTTLLCAVVIGCGRIGFTEQFSEEDPPIAPVALSTVSARPSTVPGTPAPTPTPWQAQKPADPGATGGVLASPGSSDGTMATAGQISSAMDPGTAAPTAQADPPTAAIPPVTDPGITEQEASPSPPVEVEDPPAEAPADAQTPTDEPPSTDDPSTEAPPAEAPPAEQPPAEQPELTFSCANGRGVNASDPLIDDLEDGDGELRRVDGRWGYWYTVNDGTAGTQTPAHDAPFTPDEPGFDGSRHAAHFQASGFTSWGAATGTRLLASGSELCAYDASSYLGIRFWAKGSGEIKVSVMTLGTLRVADGGTCTQACYDYYAARIHLDGTFRPYQFSWQSLRQDGWGQATRFRTSEVVGVEFGAGSGGAAFELWVDDLAFY